MFSENELEQVLKRALRGGGEFADIFIEDTKHYSIYCEENKIEKVQSGHRLGAGIRVTRGDSSAYGYTNELSLQNLLSVAERVSAAVQAGNGDITIDLRKVTSDLEFDIAEPPDRVAVEEKVSAVLSANRAARAVDRRVTQVVVAYGDIIQKVYIANSEGEYVEDERVRVRMACNAIASLGEITQTGYESIGGVAGFEILRNKPAEIGRLAGQRAVIMLEADPAPAGRMAVVMAGEAGGTMVHEACGHGLEADLVQKGLSVYGGRVGEQVASPLVTVIDDATMPGKYGSFRFDDEGTRAQETVLIEKGVLKEFMYDRLRARKEGRGSTGNGRRESYQHNPIPRMTNTYILPGNLNPEEIIEATKKGLLVRRMGGGQVNTTNGDFVFQVSEGYLIENGRVTQPVRGATLTGNGPEALASVDMVGNDLGFAIGVCGKGQAAPVSDGQPTLRIPQLVVGGIINE